MRYILIALLLTAGLCAARDYHPDIERSYERHYPFRADGWQVTYTWTERVASREFEVGADAEFEVVFIVENLDDVRLTPQEMLAAGFVEVGSLEWFLSH